MNRHELTDRERLATIHCKQGKQGMRGKTKLAAAALASLTLAACVTVEAPDKPIVIELNVNIRQEVIYRLAEDAGNTIEENADIF
ncbi:YnbE family lipoprotein [Qipengyuania aquimaris]|nr:YnbE family lipoprotein [Qipengyuania aquimaris]